MRHAVLPGENAVVVTTHDGGFHTALLMHGAGAKIIAVVDGRESGNREGVFEKKIRDLAIPVYKGLTAHAAHGRKRIESVEVGPITGGNSVKSFDCDLLVIAVGFKPQINLLSMGNKSPKWDSERQILKVSELPSGVFSAGEVHGSAGFARLYSEGFQSGKDAALNKISPGILDIAWWEKSV